MCACMRVTIYSIKKNKNECSLRKKENAIVKSIQWCTSLEIHFLQHSSSKFSSAVLREIPITTLLESLGGTNVNIAIKACKQADDHVALKIMTTVYYLQGYP